jgi:uncharacterized membrane protein
MRPHHGVGLVVLTVAVLSGATVPAAAVGAETGAAPAVATPHNGTDPAAVFRVNLTGDGDARWTVTTRVAVDGPEDRRALRALAADARNGTADVGYDLATFRAFADDAQTQAGRRMRVTDPTWRAETDGPVGVLAFSLTWENFSTVEDDRVVLDSPFGTDNESWFPRVGPDQRLVVNPPPGYAVVDSTYPPEDGAIRIDGPASLEDRNVSAVYAPITTGSGGDDDRAGGPGPLVLGGVALAVLVSVGVAVVVYRDRDRERPTPAASDGAGGVDADGPVPPESDGADAGPTAADPPAEATPGADASANGETADTEPGEETGAVDESDEDTGLDEELLSDEERVERLLAENGGRMKQGDIVSETGWSNAKVSQLLSGMADDDRVDKLRIGRENLIALPEEDVGDLE